MALSPTSIAALVGAGIIQDQGSGVALKKVAVLGDSISRNNTVTPYSYLGIGPVSQALAMSDFGFFFDDTLNFGVSGETAAQIKARVGTVIAAQPDRCIVLMGTNSISAGVSASSIISDTADTVNALAAAGIAVDLIPILPRDYQMDATKGQIWADARAGQISLAGGLISLLRCDTPLSTGVDYHAIAGALCDDLHPGVYGASLMYPAILAKYASFLKPQGLLSGNLLSPNATLTGSGGTKGTGVTGSVADGWRLERNSGSTLTAVASKMASDAGQIIDLSAPGTTGAASESVRMIIAAGNIATTGLNTNDKYQFEVQVSGENLQNVRSVRAYAQSTVSSFKHALGGGGGSGVSQFEIDREPANFSKRRHRSMPFPLTTPGTEMIALAVVIEADCNGPAVSGRVTVENISLRKVV